MYPPLLVDILDMPSVYLLLSFLPQVPPMCPSFLIHYIVLILSTRLLSVQLEVFFALLTTSFSTWKPRQILAETFTNQVRCLLHYLFVRPVKKCLWLTRKRRIFALLGKGFLASFLLFQNYDNNDVIYKLAPDWMEGWMDGCILATWITPSSAFNFNYAWQH